MRAAALAPVLDREAVNDRKVYEYRSRLRARGFKAITLVGRNSLDFGRSFVVETAIGPECRWSMLIRLRLMSLRMHIDDHPLARWREADEPVAVR
jgi:hypothetical protein